MTVGAAVPVFVPMLFLMTMALAWLFMSMPVGLFVCVGMAVFMTVSVAWGMGMHGFYNFPHHLFFRKLLV